MAKCSRSHAQFRSRRLGSAVRAVSASVSSADFSKIGGAVADVLGVVLVAVVAERAEELQHHQLGKADDGIERRAQVVVDARHELRPGPLAFGAQGGRGVRLGGGPGGVGAEALNGDLGHLEGGGPGGARCGRQRVGGPWRVFGCDDGGAPFCANRVEPEKREQGS